MNATIEKIVNLLFEDLAETEETIAIREEILQNCQERYQDLREAGISEDDAIHAVIESLSGMEEMLSEYPRKADEPVQVPETPEAEETEEENEDVRAWSCDPALSPIREIRMEHMGSADVIVCASQDHLVHVECSKPELTLMTAIENGVLTIALSEQKQEEVKEEIKFSLQEGFDLSSLGKMFEKLAKRFVSAARASGAEITLCIPRTSCPMLNVHTTSGTVHVESKAFDQLRIGTASGDIELNDVCQKELHISSASGDIDLTDICSDVMHLSSVSGDITLTGGSSAAVTGSSTSGDVTLNNIIAQQVQLNSISGDVELDGNVLNVSFKTVSGDVCVSLAGELQNLSGKSTNGDVEVHLPTGIQAEVQCSSISGDICNHTVSIPGAPASVKISTVSGDIEVC